MDRERRDRGGRRVRRDSWARRAGREHHDGRVCRDRRHPWGSRRDRRDGRVRVRRADRACEAVRDRSRPPAPPRRGPRPPAPRLLRGPGTRRRSGVGPAAERCATGAASAGRRGPAPPDRRRRPVLHRPSGRRRAGVLDRWRPPPPAVQERGTVPRGRRMDARHSVHRQTPGVPGGTATAPGRRGPRTGQDLAGQCPVPPSPACPHRAVGGRTAPRRCPRLGRRRDAADRHGAAAGPCPLAAPAGPDRRGHRRLHPPLPHTPRLPAVRNAGTGDGPPGQPLPGRSRVRADGTLAFRRPPGCAPSGCPGHLAPSPGGGSARVCSPSRSAAGWKPRPGSPSRSAPQWQPAPWLSPSRPGTGLRPRSGVLVPGLPCGASEAAPKVSVGGVRWPSCMWSGCPGWPVRSCGGTPRSVSLSGPCCPMGAWICCGARGGCW